MARNHAKCEASHTTRIENALARDVSASAAYDALAAHADVLIVGGAVRDALLGADPKDVDLIVCGMPADDVSRILGALPGRVSITGKAFGVLRYRARRDVPDVEIALPRREFSTGDGHRDFTVVSDHSLPVERDLERRDFTFNAIAYRPGSGDLIDPCGGIADISSRTLRCVSAASFGEDPLRLLRAVRFVATHRFTPSGDTMEQMASHAGRIRHLSRERIGAEWFRTMGAQFAAHGAHVAADSRVAEETVPDGVASPHRDAYRAAADALNVSRVPAAPHVAAALYLSALFTRTTGARANHASRYLRGLKLPNVDVTTVENIVAVLVDAPTCKPTSVRAALSRIPAGDRPLAVDALDLSRGEATPYTDHYRRILNEGSCLDLSALAIRGDDCLRAGITGKDVGRALRASLSYVVENPHRNSRKELAEFISQWQSQE